LCIAVRLAFCFYGRCSAEAPRLWASKACSHYLSGLGKAKAQLIDKLKLVDRPWVSQLLASWTAAVLCIRKQVDIMRFMSMYHPIPKSRDA